MRWVDGTVTVEDSVASSTSLGGDLLRTTFLPSITTVTLGLVRMRDRSLYLGPVRLITFGPPKMSSTSVSWPIDGGLLVASAGGRFTIESRGGELRATLDGYNPMLPRSLYEAAQLRLHHGLVRVQLLRLAGLPPPQAQPAPASRAAAAAIDAAVCAGLALACWTTSGRTVGGRVMSQRVVSIDGSRLSLVQAALRLAALPISALQRYPAHDDIAATTVVEDTPV